MLKEKLSKLGEFALKNSKIVFPIIVIAAVAFTVSVALSLGDSGSNAELLKLENVETQTEEIGTVATETVPLIQNDSDEIYSLIATYYNAMALGDIETVTSICDQVEEQELIKIEELANYIESYPVLEIYTKPGPEAGSTIAYVYYRVTFANRSEEFPGYSTYYICTNEDGSLYLKMTENTEEVNAYIGDITTQDDVIEFNNKVTVEYNEFVTNNAEAFQYLQELDAYVTIAVGEELTRRQQEAQAQAEAEAAQTQAAENQQTGETTNEAIEPVVQYATATTTVNVRSSDSEQADKLGKVEGGTKLQVVEVRENGWTKVIYETKEGYIKSEYLQMAESADGVEVIGTVTATTNINVRAAASQEAERLGVLAGGDSVELIANEGEWSKIKYNGQIGYVKSEYVQ